MNKQEIKDYFLKKAGDGDFEKETQRIIKELEDFKIAWMEKTISKFLDSDSSKFIREHEGLSPDEIFEILLKHSNIAELYSVALKSKLDSMRGKVEA